MLFDSWLRGVITIIFRPLNEIIAVYPAIEKCVTRLVLLLEQLLIPEVLSVFLKFTCKGIFTLAWIVAVIFTCSLY